MPVDLDDRITIATPEGVEVALGLAGLGSRFIAGAVDLMIEGLTIVILAALTGALSGGSGFARAVFVVLAFTIWFFYNVLFEVLGSGRTPGKGLSHLRVVRTSGAPVDLPASAIRNLVRVIDGVLLLYLPTVVSIAITTLNQRPGDIAAGTLVIREQPRRSGREAPLAAEQPIGWDVSAVSADEVAAVRQFLDRRNTLDWPARRTLALRLASGLRPKVTGAPAGVQPEWFLEQLVSAKARGR